MSVSIVPLIYELWQIRKGIDWLLLIAFGSDTGSAAIFMFTTVSPAVGLKRSGREADRAVISVYSRGRDYAMFYPYTSAAWRLLGTDASWYYSIVCIMGLWWAKWHCGRFFRVFRFVLPVLIPLAAPHSSSSMADTVGPMVGGVQNGVWPHPSRLKNK